MAQLCQHLGKIGRQGALHGDPLPGAGVDKGEPSGVKALARQAGDGLLGPVYHVPQQGVADGGHVDPDLVGAPRFQAKPNEGAAEIVPVIETPVMGDGVFPMIHIDAAFDGGTIFSGDWQIDGAGFFWFTGNNREIFAAYLFFCSHGGEKCAAYFMFGDQQKTGGVAV